MLDAASIILELQQMRDDGHLSDALLRKAVRTVSEDDRFDWVGVYLLRDEELWLHNYIGEPTEHAKIPVGTGVCGRAIAERTNLNIPDVSKEEDYLACSPDVQSELVILIRAGEDIFGQIDPPAHLLLHHPVYNKDPFFGHLAKSINAIIRKPHTGPVNIEFFREFAAKSFFNTFLTQHKSQQASPGGRRIVGIPPGQGADLYGLF